MMEKLENGKTGSKNSILTPLISSTMTSLSILGDLSYKINLYITLMHIIK